MSCEALGSPSPQLQWLKDGHPIRESVLPSQPPAGGGTGGGGAPLSASSGRSAVEFQVRGGHVMYDVTWMNIILGSKVECLFCFETWTTEGRGGEKGGSANLRTSTQNL